MKSSVVVSFLMLATLASCQQEKDSPLVLATDCSGTASLSLCWSQQEALEIAQNIINQNDVNKLTTSFITSGSKDARSGNLDTLAYVINAGNNNGFALIAYNKISNPILAYSETGFFDPDIDKNEPVYDAFISKLPQYYAKSSEIGIQPPKDISYIIPNFLNIFPWSQDEAFAKYVNKTHPNCPVGCVPLSIARALVYSGKKIEIKNVVVNDSITDIIFHFDSIKSYLTTYYNNSIKSSLTDVIRKKNDIAIDSLSFFFEIAGKKMKASYSESETLVTDSKLCEFLDSISVSYAPRISNGLWEYFDCNDVFLAIMRKNMVLVGGKNKNNKGHCWVIDGGAFSYKQYPTDENDMYDHIMFHCDWGQNGYKNGYYAGPVFQIMSDDGLKWEDGYTQTTYVEIIK